MALPAVGSSKRWPSVATCLALLAACSSQPDGSDAQHGGNGLPDAGGGDAGQAGSSDGGAAGAAGRSSVEAGAGGEAGVRACTPATCDDGDPCTVDTCAETDASGCVHAFSAGLGLEKDFAPITADAQYRVTLTAGSKAFYFSTFSRTAAKNEVEVLRLGQNDDVYTSLKKLSSYPAFAGGLISAAGLAIDNSAALGESLHALVATKTPGGDAQVWQLMTDGNEQLGAPQKVGDSYASASVFNHPVERALAGIVHGGWINADGTISVLSPGGSSPAIFGAASTPAGTLTLVGTDANKPAVVFTGQTSKVWLQTIGHAPVPVLECQSAEGGFSSLGATLLAGHDGVWFTVWTKYAANILTTESHALLCSNGTCIPDTTTLCKDSDNDNRQRNWATESVHVPGDSPEQTYFVVAGPGLSEGRRAGSVRASIALSLTRLTSPLERTGSSEAVGLPLTIADQAAKAPDFRGPDFPAVAILPGSPVKVAVAWVQPPAPGTTSSADELHLQRYRMCLPKQ